MSFNLWYQQFTQRKTKPQVFTMGVLSRAHRLGHQPETLAIANDKKWCRDKRRQYAKA